MMGTFANICFSFSLNLGTGTLSNVFWNQNR